MIICQSLIKSLLFVIQSSPPTTDLAILYLAAKLSSRHRANSYFWSWALSSGHVYKYNLFAFAVTWHKSGCKYAYLIILDTLKQNKLNIWVCKYIIGPTKNKCLQCLKSLKTLLKAFGLAPNIYKNSVFFQNSARWCKQVVSVCEKQLGMYAAGIQNLSAWTCCCIITSDKISSQRPLFSPQWGTFLVYVYLD